jgi:hypothetical protein
VTKKILDIPLHRNRVGGSGQRDSQDRKRDGHTPAWDKQSLGVIEAAALRMAWAPAAQGFVTENSDGTDQA